MTSDDYELPPIFMRLGRAIVLLAAFVNAYLRSFINESTQRQLSDDDVGTATDRNWPVPAILGARIR
jgi:hypothetical protein